MKKKTPISPPAGPVEWHPAAHQAPYPPQQGYAPPKGYNSPQNYNSPQGYNPPRPAQADPNGYPPQAYAPHDPYAADPYGGGQPPWPAQGQAQNAPYSPQRAIPSMHAMRSPAYGTPIPDPVALNDGAETKKKSKLRRKQSKAKSKRVKADGGAVAGRAVFGLSRANLRPFLVGTLFGMAVMFGFFALPLGGPAATLEGVNFDPAVQSTAPNPGPAREAAPAPTFLDQAIDGSDE